MAQKAKLYNEFVRARTNHLYENVTPKSRSDGNNQQCSPKNEQKNTCNEMSNIMNDWHKSVYHHSSFTVNCDMNTTNLTKKVDAESPENPVVIETQCRICMSSEDSLGNQQVTPCGCTGSLRYVHMECLKQWRQTRLAKGNDVSTCEICGQKYNVQLLGENDVTQDKILKMEEDLKKLVKSGIYLVMLMKSLRNEIADSQDQIIAATSVDAHRPRQQQPFQNKRIQFPNHNSVEESSSDDEEEEINRDYVSRSAVKRNSMMNSSKRPPK